MCQVDSKSVPGQICIVPCNNRNWDMAQPPIAWRIEAAQHMWWTWGWWVPNKPTHLTNLISWRIAATDAVSFLGLDAKTPVDTIYPMKNMKSSTNSSRASTNATGHQRMRPIPVHGVALCRRRKQHLLPACLGAFLMVQVMASESMRYSQDLCTT